MDSLKRKRGGQSSGTTKRVNQNHNQIGECTTPLQEAERFELTRAKVPLDALVTDPTAYHRPINSEHVDKLCKSFQKDGIKLEEENYILVEARGDLVRRIKEGFKIGENGDNDCRKVLSFMEWNKVNKGETMVILNGLHRVLARRRCIEMAKADLVLGPQVGWWTCIIYKETLPAKLRNQLRMNRRKLEMADSDGQIWWQVLEAFRLNSKLFDGTKEVIREALLLSNEGSRSPDQVITLWRKSGWRESNNALCEWTFGRRIFKIERWIWISSLLMDTFWLRMVEEIIEMLRVMPKVMREKITAKEWEKLANARERVPLGGNGDGPRFQSLGVLLKLTRAQGKIIQTVMKHVVAWVDEWPVEEVNQQKAEKAQLRQGLVKVLAETGEERERKSIEIERLVVETVWENMEELSDSAGRALLDMVPRSGEGWGLYKVRFNRRPWKVLVERVEEVCGINIRQRWDWADGLVDWRAGLAGSIINGALAGLEGYARDWGNGRMNSDGRRKRLMDIIKEEVGGWTLEEEEEDCDEEGVVRIIRGEIEVDVASLEWKPPSSYERGSETVRTRAGKKKVQIGLVA